MNLLAVMVGAREPSERQLIMLAVKVLVVILSQRLESDIVRGKVGY